MEKIIIIGASGFIGNHLVNILQDKEVKTLHGKELITKNAKDIAKIINGADVLVNVAGRSIFTIWTRNVKKEIRESRVHLTRKIIEAMCWCEKPPRHFLNASTIGIYKNEMLVTENENQYASNFLANIVKEWESEAFKALDLNIKVTVMRFGIVMGRESGAYRVMRTLTKFNLGGYFGKGNQSLSFIYIHDLVRAIRFLIDNEIEGIVNLTSGDITDYKTTFEILKNKFHSVILWRVPRVIPKILLGKANVIYLEGQKVIPEILIKNSFNFEASNISDCVNKLEAN